MSEGADERMKASVTTMSDKPVDHTWVELNKAIDAAGTNGAEPSIGFTGKGIVEAALGVKARVMPTHLSRHLGIVSHRTHRNNISLQNDTFCWYTFDVL